MPRDALAGVEPDPRRASPLAFLAQAGFAQVERYGGMLSGWGSFELPEACGSAGTRTRLAWLFPRHLDKVRTEMSVGERWA